MERKEIEKKECRTHIKMEILWRVLLVTFEVCGIVFKFIAYFTPILQSNHLSVYIIYGRPTAQHNKQPIDHQI